MLGYVHGDAMQTLDDYLQYMWADDILAATERARHKSHALDDLELMYAVSAAFDELDLRQLAILSRLSPTRRLQMMFDLCELSRQLIAASERQRDPNITDQELSRRVRARIELAYGA